MKKPKFRVGMLLRYGADYVRIVKIHSGHIHCVRFAAPLTAQLTNIEADDQHLRLLTAREMNKQKKEK